MRKWKQMAEMWWQGHGTFVAAAAKRAVRTMAQTAAAVGGVGTVMSDVDWVRLGSTALLAGILSVLTSLSTGLPEAGDGGAGGGGT